METRDSEPNLTEIKAARETLGTLVRETPVWELKSKTGTERWGKSGGVYLKLELFQFGGSFKPRGALLNMMALSGKALKNGVTAVSAGNHAIAVGYASRVLGTSAKVVMPLNADPNRVEISKSLGAEVILVEDVHQAFAEVERIKEAEGRAFIHPFEGYNTVLGTATLGWEFVNQVKDLDIVVIPIGGGGLCAGVASAVKQYSPKTVIYGVEPTGADSMTRSFRSGKPEAIEQVNTIADSLGAPYAAPYSFSICHKYVDDIVLVDDDALCKSMAFLFRELKLALEPAGAAAMSAILGPLESKIEGKKVGLIVCGSNIDPETFYQYLSRGEAILKGEE